MKLGECVPDRAIGLALSLVFSAFATQGTIRKLQELGKLSEEQADDLVSYRQLRHARDTAARLGISESEIDRAMNMGLNMAQKLSGVLNEYTGPERQLTGKPSSRLS